MSTITSEEKDERSIRFFHYTAGVDNKYDGLLCDVKNYLDRKEKEIAEKNSSRETKYRIRDGNVYDLISPKHVGIECEKTFWAMLDEEVEAKEHARLDPAAQIASPLSQTSTEFTQLIPTRFKVEFLQPTLVVSTFAEMLELVYLRVDGYIPDVNAFIDDSLKRKNGNEILEKCVTKMLKLFIQSLTMTKLSPTYEEAANILFLKNLERLCRERNTYLDFIVKSQAYVLKEGEFYSGGRHIEGEWNDKITHVGIMVVQLDPGMTTTLSVGSEYEMGFRQIDNTRMHEGSMIVFPNNTHEIVVRAPEKQSQSEPQEEKSKEMSEKYYDRKILSFFMVMNETLKEVVNYNWLEDSLYVKMYSGKNKDYFLNGFGYDGMSLAVKLARKMLPINAKSVMPREKQHFNAYLEQCLLALGGLDIDHQPCIRDIVGEYLSFGLVLSGEAEMHQIATTISAARIPAMQHNLFPGGTDIVMDGARRWEDEEEQTTKGCLIA